MNEIEDVLVKHVTDLQKSIELAGYEIHPVSSTRSSANLGNGSYLYNLSLIVKKLEKVD